MDPCSYSYCDVFSTNHVDIDWTIDFNETKLVGKVNMHFEVLKNDAKELVLDSRDLKVSKMVCEGKQLEYTVGDKHEAFGSKLIIQLPKTYKKSDKFNVEIFYETSSNATALQWLKREQTLGKEQPYMFSQCQAIHARSVIPCQDSPGDKFTYKANVTVANPLVVLMSANDAGNTQNGNTTTYHFEQQTAIPSYLLAVACGLLQSKKIGPRTQVWSEKGYIERAAYEFAETEKMLQAAEKIAGPYVWGKYDLLVLPPTFPYGGMENPNLTFVTPTLLAGDRSLANVVAHEIAHSWTGNLVTNRTWEHFWLNEGHTVFLERKILKEFYGEETRALSNLGGQKSLKDSVELFGHENQLTCLVTNLKDIDPDDAFSTVPYEKGSSLLCYLEQLLGGPEKFNPFLKAYVKRFAYKALDSYEWKDFVYEFFAEKKEVLDTVDWESWLHKPGMLPVQLTFDDTLLKQSKQLAEKWANAEDFSKFKESDLTSMTTKQKIEFLAELINNEGEMSIEAYRKLGETYKLHASGNSEIKFRYLMLGLKCKCKEAIEPALKMAAVEQGRMKFTRPLFRSLGAWSDSRGRAIEVLKNNHKQMHSTTATLVAKDLKITAF